MSNQLYMDESNGNGVYATKSNNTSLSGTTVTANNVSNNINVIMNAASTSAITAATTGTLPTSVSSEDLSQSLSEYTDADESISAPTEFLAEFLSAVMLKDYKKALKYCKLILQYEPNNSTAREFYPLIMDKLRGTELSDSDENYNKSSSLELPSSDPEASDEHNANESALEPISRMDDGADEFGVSEDNSSGEPNSNYSNLSSSICGSPVESFSESLDDERENDNDDDDNDADKGAEEDEEDNDDGDVNDDDDDDDDSSSSDDFPIDEQNDMIDDCGGIVADAGRASHSSSGGEGRSRSDNTTHSYSSLLLEEEEADIVPVNLQFTKDLSVHDLDVSNGNKIPSASCSDSESPTEPLTQRLAAILRSTCGVSSSTKDTK